MVCFNGAKPSYHVPKFKFTVEGRTFVTGKPSAMLHHLMDVFSKQDVFVTFMEAQWEENSSKSNKPSNGFMMLGHRACTYSLRHNLQYRTSLISAYPALRFNMRRRWGRQHYPKIKSGSYRFHSRFMDGI